MPPRSLRHRSTHLEWAAPAAVLLACAVGGCSKDAVVTTRTVVAHVPKGCAVDGQGYATYAALGDYPATPPQAGHFLSSVGEVLPEVDTRARELVLSASEGGATWEGLTPVAASGDIDVLVLPAFQSCALAGDVMPRTGATLAPIGSGRVLLVGGDRTQPSEPTPLDYVVRLDTSQVSPVSPELQFLRRQPSITAFGTGGLVAGGFSASTGAPLDDAQVFDPSVGGFTTHVTLSEPRAGHAAVVLRDGRTLLIGGVGGADGKTPLTSMDVVDPARNLAQEPGVGPLDVALASPSAVVLASGEVLVAGRAVVAGVTETVVQWFNKDGSPSPIPRQVMPAGAALALVALQAGGALAVIAPPAGAPSTFQSTWMISARYAVDAAKPVPGTLTRPMLLGGAGGAPLLWTGDRWLQWSPWSGAFTASSILDGPSTALGTAACSPDPGLALWLDATAGRLVALRFDIRNAYSNVDSALLVNDALDVAPASLPGQGGVSFDSATGLTLVGGDAAFVTDRAYADFSLRFAVPTGVAPDVVLREASGQEHVVAATCCALAPGASDATVDLERRGSSVTCSVNGGGAATCSVSVDEAASVQLGLRSSPSGSAAVVRDLVVSRVARP